MGGDPQQTCVLLSLRDVLPHPTANPDVVTVSPGEVTGTPGSGRDRPGLPTVERQRGCGCSISRGSTRGRNAI